MYKRPNFYEILELDPSITNMSVIEPIIKRKKDEWNRNRNQGSPSQKRKAEQYLKYIEDMEILFRDTKATEDESKKYKQLTKDKEKEQLIKLDELIQNIHSEIVSSDIINVLIKQTEKKFTKDEIEKRLKKHGKSLENTKSTKRKSSSQPVLESALAKSIKEKLQIIKLHNLYDFLNLDNSPKLSKRSSTKSLYARANLIYKELSRKSITPDNTLKKELTGDAKSIFSNDKMKDRYDNTYEQEALDALKPHLEVAGANKFIEMKNMESLLILGKKLGVHKSIVNDYIYNYASKRKWTIQQESKTINIKLLTCGYCGELSSSEKSSRCAKCGENLIESCPKCGNATPTENYSCTKCGCHTGDAPLTNSLLREAKTLFNKGDYTSAIACLNRSLEYWEDWDPAKKMLADINREKQEHNESLNKINLLIKQRKLENANTELTKYKNNYNQKNVNTIATKINDGIKNANSLYKEAEKFRKSGNDEKAFDKYEESLSYCVDFLPAISAMSDSPPPAPTNLRTKWMNSTLQLMWEEVKAKGTISYTVVRKKDGRPSTLKDGEIITETSNIRVDDSAVISGIVYYYAIFTMRSGVPSKKSATVGPFLLTNEVKNIDSTAGNKQISLSWDAPKGSILVEVWKREGLAPSKRGEGKKLILSSNSLVDTKLINGQRYGYLIVAKYPNPKDAKTFLFSEGIKVTAIPISPPKPINDLKIKRNKNIIFLSWTQIEKDIDIQIRQTQSIDINNGEIVSLKNIDSYGKLIPITSHNSTQTTLSTQGRVYFIPFSIRQETAVTGEPVMLTTLDEISDLSSKQSGSSIFLTWSWPNGAKEVLVAYNHEHFPINPSDGMTKKVITRAEYKKNNFWELRLVEKKKYYFTIFIRDPSSNIYSNGINILESMGQETIVKYEVKVEKKFWSKKIKSTWIEFKGEVNEPIENLVVVYKEKFPPTSKDDGMTIATIKSLSFEENIAIFDIPNEHIEKVGYIKIFFSSTQISKEIRLLPAPIQKLKLTP